MPAAADEFLTVAEIAGLLKLNQQTVRNLIDNGSLAAVRVGPRRVRVRRSAPDAFLVASSMDPVPPEDAADRWRAIGEAAAAITQAVQAQDGAALKRAMSGLRKAARGL